jgi:hypothetical protein
MVTSAYAYMLKAIFWPQQHKKVVTISTANWYSVARLGEFPDLDRLFKLGKLIENCRKNPKN